MKRMWIGLGIIFAATMAFSQQAPPALSTSDRVALQSLEERKQQATKSYQDSYQAELAIMREWNAGHAGWHLNEQTFVPEPDTKPTAKQEVKPVTPVPQPGKTTPAQTPK